MTTIVVTNTLANLARDSRLAGGSKERWMPRLLAILAMGVGAAVGALILRVSDGSIALYAAMVFYAAGLVTLVVTARSRTATS